MARGAARGVRETEREVWREGRGGADRQCASSGVPFVCFDGNERN